jgi:hypothetical protein
MRADDPKVETKAVEHSLFDTERVAPDTSLVCFFQRPVGQRDLAGEFKTCDSTSMFMGGCIPTPHEFKGTGVRWMTDDDPDRVGFELSRAVLWIDHGMDRLLAVVASHIPLGTLNEISYKLTDNRASWALDVDKKPSYPLNLRLRWAECFGASLFWPKGRPEEGFKIRLALLGRLFVPEGC